MSTSERLHLEKLLQGWNLTLVIESPAANKPEVEVGVVRISESSSATKWKALTIRTYKKMSFFKTTIVETQAGMLNGNHCFGGLFFLILILFLKYVCGFYLHVYLILSSCIFVFLMSAWCLRRSEESIRASGL